MYHLIQAESVYQPWAAPLLGKSANKKQKTQTLLPIAAEPAHPCVALYQDVYQKYQHNNIQYVPGMSGVLAATWATGNTAYGMYHRDQVGDLWKEFTPTLKQMAEAYKTDTWQPRRNGLCREYCDVTSCAFNPKHGK